MTESKQLRGKDSSLLEEDEVDLRAFRPARGPIFLQALELPPQPKTINSWTVKKGKYSYTDCQLPLIWTPEIEATPVLM